MLSRDEGHVGPSRGMGRPECRPAGRGKSIARKPPSTAGSDPLWRLSGDSAVRPRRYSHLGGGDDLYILLAFFPAVGASSRSTAFADSHGARACPICRASCPWMCCASWATKWSASPQRIPRNWAVDSLGLLISIWFANSGVSSLMVGLNVAYEQKETRGSSRATSFRSVSRSARWSPSSSPVPCWWRFRSCRPRWGFPASIFSSSSVGRFFSSEPSPCSPRFIASDPITSDTPGGA